MAKTETPEIETKLEKEQAKEIKRLRTEVLEVNEKLSEQGYTATKIDDPADQDRLTLYTAGMLAAVKQLPTNPEALTAMMSTIDKAANDLVSLQSVKELD